MGHDGKIALVVPLALLVTTLACGGSGPTDSELQATSNALQLTANALDAAAPQATQRQPQATLPTQPQSQSQTGQGSGSGVPFEVLNQSSSEICYLYISPTRDEAWGSDWLGANETLGPGGSRTFSVSPGVYDLRAEGCDHGELGQQLGIDLSTPRSWTFSSTSGGQTGGSQTGGSQAGGSVALTLINDTSQDVCYVWIGAPASEWSGDLLGDSLLPAWSSVTVYVAPGTWALSAEDCSGGQMQFTGAYNITASTAWHINQASGVTSAGSGSYCGDAVCGNYENAGNCPQDCGWCGDGWCDTLENNANCALDCGSPGDWCGDGVCDPWETADNCALDCGWCGDGWCTIYEDIYSCPFDCGSGGACGDGVCDAWEDVFICDIDCGFCGDGWCTVFENPGNCAQDCSTGSGADGSLCGDGICQSGESSTWCGDCP